MRSPVDVTDSAPCATCPAALAAKAEHALGHSVAGLCRALRRTARPEPALPGDPVMTAAPFFPAGRPRVIGIVNITEDSFSDGGRDLAPAGAIRHARGLRAEGADIIELGAAASHPGSKLVTAAEEQQRLAPVMDRLLAEGIPVSVDSFQPATQRFALSRGAGYLNDIQGFPDHAMYDALAGSACRLIVMHSVQRTGPATRVMTDPDTIMNGIGRFFTARLAALQAAGISRDRLILDPGLGYFLGSTPAPSLAALAGISDLRARFGLPVLVSPSRKSFLRALTGKDDTGRAGPATLAAEIFAAWQGADYIRTHDVAALRDAITILQAVASRCSLVSGGCPAGRPRCQ
jgi:dihydropteroate synthase type 2